MYAETFTETAISNAVEDAISTALKWGSPVNRDNRAEGGVVWSTYKAICRRNGTYANAQGPHVSRSPQNCAYAEPRAALTHITRNGTKPCKSKLEPKAWGLKYSTT